MNVYRHSSWFAARGLTPDQLISVAVDGHKNAPYLCDGDIAIFDTCERDLIDGRYYLVEADGDKRIERFLGKALAGNVIGRLVEREGAGSPP